ncbi:MAG: N-acetylmuramoyl-L-alanine amidase [Alphaproteobacteria bacterium]|nr:N-acetylmuramoyl-L-alanine amidase [Alphaproteobacteria bacterium]MBU2342015.1 N-acetylmuramoyl-L-alanine amidase [Alphaproteobacteria bacterium]
MARFLPLILLALIPVTILAVLAGAAVTGRALDLPQPGRGPVLRVELPASDDGVPLPEIAGEERGGEESDLPLVVIDPGHGGHDPGASSEGMQEKDLVLRLARALRDRLLERGDVRVALTRNEDRYLLHAERYEIARRLGADLFVSIHADSAGEATEVAGASIYTLSNDASSEAAARFAERENRSDRINGQEIAGQSDAVNTILVELSQRRTQAESAEFASLIQREGAGTIRFHPQPRRSAALKVLRAPDVPSVLYESGFITNADEAQRLASPEGRARFAEVMARAIRIYFIRQREDLLEPPAALEPAGEADGVADTDAEADADTDTDGG